MAFIDLTARLTGQIPSLSPLLADQQINNAWQDIRRERTWGFLVADAAIVCPPQVTSGAIAIVQFANTVTLDAIASAAFPADSATPAPTLLQIRFTSTGAGASIYNIRSVSRTVPAALVLTLDRIVLETTNAASPYQLYRCYITPPDTDFLRFEELNDFTNGLTIGGPKLTYTSAYFDQRDPQRAYQGFAYFCGFYRGAASDDPNSDLGAPIYELWPHPTSGQRWYVRYHRSGNDFASITDAQLGNVVLDQLILERALGWYTYPWAQANVGNYPTLKSVNWPYLASESKKAYIGMLTSAKRNDEEQAPQNVWNRGHGLRTGRFTAGAFPYPIDAAFFQKHAIFW